MSSTYCDGCFRVDKSTNAVRFCMDCEESLCRECIAAHKTIKVLTTHQMVDLTDFSAGKVKELAAKRHCKTHHEYTLDYFCTYHDTLCCHACIPVDHRACDKILSLNEASKNVKSSALFSDISDGLKLVSSAASETMQNREENIQRVTEQATAMTGSISAFKETIINKLDEMEKGAMKGLSDLKHQTISKLVNEMDNAKDVKSAVEKYSEQFQFMLENGSENQTFVFLQELRVMLLNQDQTLKDVISKLGELNLNFTETNIIRENGLGSIKVQSEPCDVQHKHTKQFGAQIMLPIRKTPKKFTYNSKFKIKEKESQNYTISGIASDNKELYVCSSTSNKVFTYSTDGKCKGIIVLLKEKPWDIALHPKSGKIVATLRNGSLQMIENMKTTTKADAHLDTSYGVAWNNNDLVVGGKAEICFLNPNMEHIKTLKLGDDIIYYIHIKDEHIYLSDYNKVYCIDKEGNSIFTFSSPTLINPDGIATDGNGNVYVVGRTSNNVHRLSPQGTESEIVITAADGIKDPITICFSPDYKSLYLSNESGKSIWIFDCDY